MRIGSAYRRKQNNSKILIIISILLIVAITMIIIFSAPKSTRLKYGALSQSDQWDALVIFNEVLIDLPDNERIIFGVSNNKYVHAQQEIGQYYKKGYLTSAFETYSELQEKIVQYQDDVLLKDIYQHELNQYSIEISTVLTELQAFDSKINDYIELNEKLNTLLQARQFYIRDNYPADEFLQSLYEEENMRLTALNDWIEPINAVSNGYVSWYVNSAYRNINTLTAIDLTVTDVKTLMDKDSSIYKNVNNSSDFGVRIISEGYVYFAINVKKDVTFNGYTVLYSNFSSDPINCTVVNERIEGNEKRVIFKAECNVEVLLEHRCVTLSTTPFVYGYILDKKFVHNEGVGDYVLIDDGNKDKKAVFVNVLAINGDMALILPGDESDKILQQDTTVYYK